MSSHAKKIKDTDTREVSLGAKGLIGKRKTKGNSSLLVRERGTQKGILTWNGSASDFTGRLEEMVSDLCRAHRLVGPVVIFTQCVWKAVHPTLILLCK